MYFCKLDTLRHVHSELLYHKMHLLDHAPYIREDGDGLKCTHCQNIRYKCTLIDVLFSILMNFNSLLSLEDSLSVVPQFLNALLDIIK